MPKRQIIDLPGEFHFVTFSTYQRRQFLAAFTYRRAGSVEEAIAFLRDDEDAKLLAGGHSLLPLMKLRLAAPTTLVDIGRIPSLAYVDERDDHIAIGAATRHHDLATSPVLAARSRSCRNG